MLASGERTPKIDRASADVKALRYAVALHRDEVLGPAVESDVYGVRGAGYGEHRRTGVKSYAAWVKALEDTDNLGEARWHSSVVRHLRINRRSAGPLASPFGRW